MNDRRYTIQREYIGRPRPWYAVYFCDKAIGYRSKRIGAMRLVEKQAHERDMVLRGKR